MSTKDLPFFYDGETDVSRGIINFIKKVKNTLLLGKTVIKKVH